MSFQKQFHFVTGKLAESALEATLKPLSEKVGFGYTTQTLPISVAALMTPHWIAKRLNVPADTDCVMIPGYCQGNLDELSKKFGVEFCLGPKDLRRLPEYFGQQRHSQSFEKYSIEIIGEINHAPRISIQQTVEKAKAMIEDGADFIDIGCVPGETCREIGSYVAAVKELGAKVSIDSLNSEEIGIACAQGAELVLSVNNTNLHAAPDWGCEVVVIPDDIRNLDSLENSIEFLQRKNVAFRVDPILEPIGLGFANSLMRYHAARSRWPEFEMMMGIGNLTELTDVDSAGINFLLLGYCQELRIKSVLTTQVINWARSSVKECDIARRLVEYACEQKTPPKNLSPDLVVLRDTRAIPSDESEISELATRIKDNNYRIMNSEDKLHLLGSLKHFSDRDPFVLFDQLEATHPKNLSPSHAFYLGYELCKAMTAMQLGKNYVQDEALDWGHLTVDETNRHRLSKRYRNS